MVRRQKTGVRGELRARAFIWVSMPKATQGRVNRVNSLGLGNLNNLYRIWASELVPSWPHLALG